MTVPKDHIVCTTTLKGWVRELVREACEPDAARNPERTRSKGRWIQRGLTERKPLPPGARTRILRALARSASIEGAQAEAITNEILQALQIPR